LVHVLGASKPKDPEKTQDSAEKSKKGDFVVLVDLNNPDKAALAEKVEESADSLPKTSEKEKPISDDVIMIDLDSDDEEKSSPTEEDKPSEVVETCKSPEKPTTSSPVKPVSPPKQTTPPKTTTPSKPTTPVAKALSPKKLTPAKTPEKPTESPSGVKRKLEVEPVKTTPPKSQEVKECVNFECKKQTKEYLKAPAFILSFFRIPKKLNKVQFVCVECFDDAVLQYEVSCCME
jgi:hypothetical protein